MATSDTQAEAVAADILRINAVLMVVKNHGSNASWSE